MCVSFFLVVVLDQDKRGETGERVSAVSSCRQAADQDPQRAKSFHAGRGDSETRGNLSCRRPSTRSDSDVKTDHSKSALWTSTAISRRNIRSCGILIVSSTQFISNVRRRFSEICDDDASRNVFKAS